MKMVYDFTNAVKMTVGAVVDQQSSNLKKTLQIMKSLLKCKCIIIYYFILLY